MPYANPENLKARNRRYYAEHREEIIAKTKAWRVENPEGRAAWREANREKLRAEGRRWYAANREKSIAWVARTRQRRLETDPEGLRAQGREVAARRRARQQAVIVEKIDPLRVWDRDKGICGICGSPADKSDWHLDHVQPIARGGEHSYLNVQVAHPFCNRSKGASWA